MSPLEYNRAPCDYCNSIYHYGADYPIIPCDNGDLGVRAQMGFGGKEYCPGIILYKDKYLASGYFKVRYCPICGRKLVRD